MPGGLPYTATLLGVKQVYPGRYVPDTLMQLIAKEGVTFSHCVPTLLQMMLSAPSAAHVDLSRWKLIIGGSALPKALCQAALDRGIDIRTGYGMSETCPILCIATLKPELIEEPGSDVYFRVKAGLPIPLVDLRIVDFDMNDLPHDGSAAGEVVVRAPWLTQGYYKNPEASENLCAGGYLHTNNIGTIDTNGYLQVTDRMKDVIKTGGEWVSSLQLEDIILLHRSVSEVAVIGVEDAKWGERPMAIVVLHGAAPADEADIKAHVMQHAERGVISKYAVPAYIRFVETIDKTSVGKINKKALRERYATDANPVLS